MTDKFIKNKSGVVVCTDDDARTSYLQQRKLAESRQTEMTRMQDQINSMQGELSEIKSLLVLLLHKKDE